MTFQRELAQFGEEAVIEYRKVPAIRKNEAAIPEGCLSLSIASKLIINQNLDARLEAPYPTMLKELGAHGTDLTPKFGGQRADIAIYDRDVPSTLIENKIVDEGRRIDGVINDCKKILLLQDHLRSMGRPIIPGYIGALICDTPGRTAEIAADELTKALGLDPALVTLGRKNGSSLGGWGWMFVCMAIG